MARMKFLIVTCAVAAASLPLVGCGKNEPTSLSASSRSTTTTAQSTAGDAGRGPKANRNRKDTAVGRVCWFYTELSTRMGDVLHSTLVEADASDESRRAMASLRSLVSNADDELGPDTGLPAGAKEFRDSLLNSAADANQYLAGVPDDVNAAGRKNAFERVTALFAFFEPSSKASQQFEEVVRNDKTGSCPDITSEANSPS